MKNSDKSAILQKMHKTYISKYEEDTQEIAKKLSSKLISGDIILLYGKLGAGKTCFVKGLAEGLQIDAFKVTSPTFIILNEYNGKIPLYHFDFYRMKNFAEIENIGFFDYIESSGITIIEWPEIVEKYIKSDRYVIKIETKTDNTRIISID